MARRATLNDRRRKCTSRSSGLSEEKSTIGPDRQCPANRRYATTESSGVYARRKADISREVALCLERALASSMSCTTDVLPANAATAKVSERWHLRLRSAALNLRFDKFLSLGGRSEEIPWVFVA